jgi:anaerobic magnesium-protoporphyrin IX monomethyl ester cyclase
MINDDEPIDFNLIKLAKDKVESNEKPELSVEDARHQQMMDAIKQYARPVQQKNLTPIYVDYKTRKSSVVLVMCPEWAPEFPPFSLARLSGVCKSAGYETRIIDLNVKAFNIHQNDWIPNNKIPFRLWDPSASWHWLGETYMKDIHPLLAPLLEEAIADIVSSNPTVVGFTQYYISEEPTNWMAAELKRRAPHIKLMVGGPNVHKDWFDHNGIYDYVVSGEGEAAILKILGDIEEGIVHDQVQILKQDELERLNINGLPMPDYTGIDFNQYRVPNGVTSEFSRGCTAKCTFCEETHFWKYRQRQAVDVLTEAEWLYYNKGVDVMWFIDSLVNGNVNELRAFAIALKEKKIPMRWTGYARCDGRMDDAYFKDLAEGGCIMFNYGCESGSQKVLDDMAKGVTVKEMEDNLRSGKKYGIYAATNWIVGFPTEHRTDFAKTMQFLWRNRNMNINNVGAGVGMAVGPATIVGQNPHKFNVSFHKYQNHWITNDFTLGGTHIMHRVKLFHMFLDLMTGCTDVPFGYPIRTNLVNDHYLITLHDQNKMHDLEYEEFDYDIIKPNISPFADNLVNEIWPFLRVLWLTRGGYDAEIHFNPEIDLREFGSQFGPGMFTGVYKFSITDNGNWTANFRYEFKQIDNPYDTRQLPPAGRKGPFFAQDYSKMQSNSARRARKLAKPEWDKEEGRGTRDFNELLEEERFLNSTVDFSFSYNYVNTGIWGKGFNIDVPDQISSGVNQDNTHLNSKSDFYENQDKQSRTKWKLIT